MKRPSVGDRWQNSRTNRVCIVEGIRDHVDPWIARVAIRFEQPSASGSTRRRTMSVAWLNATFTQLEKATS